MGLLLIPLIGISLAAFIFLAGRPNVPNEVLENEGICETIECLQIANDFLNSINESVEPCDNFYEFACGNWKFHNPPSESGFRMDGSGKLNEIARVHLRDELENESSREEILPVKQMKDLYKSCMQMTKSEGIDSIMAILDKLKGWSMIMEPDTYNSSAITWQEIDRYYEELMGLNAFYNLDIVNQPSEHGQLQISMNGGWKYEALVVIDNIAPILMKHTKAKFDKRKLKREANELKDFEEKLIKVPGTAPDIFFNNTSEFTNWWNINIESSGPQNKLDWEAIFQRLLNVRNRSMTEDTPILLKNPAYFKQLSKILASTDKRIINNFVHAQFIIEITSTWNPQIYLDWPDYTHWPTCLNDKEPAVAHLFLRRYYGSHIKAAAEEMVRNIQESFERQITRSNWLSNDLKEAAKRRVRNLKFVLGHEDWYMNETALIDYYKGLTIGDNYPKSLSHLMKHRWQKTIENWGKPVKFNKWAHSVIEASGQIGREFNSIHIPAASLQSPSLDQNIPHYFGYGKVGFIIAHETGHNFDDFNLGFFKVEILDANVKSIFTESVQCFIDLFDGYVNGSGNSTYFENLGDWYGIQTALDAYEVVKNKKYPNGELKLPGLEKYTDLQMFFLSYTQWWCGGDYRWFGKSHHGDAYRVIGTVSNTKAFAEAFKCPKNSPMNPEKKCDIWMKKLDKS